MEEKNELNNEQLEKVNGGAGNITTRRIHSYCGGDVIMEDCGTYFEDIYLTCKKCGQTWHPHSYKKVEECSDIYTVTTGTY